MQRGLLLRRIEELNSAVDFARRTVCAALGKESPAAAPFSSMRNIEDGEEDTFGESFTDRENENAKGKKVTEEMLQGLVVESKRLCEAYLDSSHQVQLLKNQVVKKEQDEQERLRENTATIAQIKSILESLIECEGSVGEQAVHLLHHVNHFIL